MAGIDIEPHTYTISHISDLTYMSDMAYKPSILFLCTGNSARSQLAEALMRHHAGAHYEVFSAGTQPRQVDPRVSEVLLIKHIEHSPLHSKSLDSLIHYDFDFVITLCDSARRECDELPGHATNMHWDIPDPKQGEGIEPFISIYSDLEQRIMLFTQVHHSHQDSFEIAPTRVFKALGDSLRLAILMLIEDEGELCVNELVEALAQSQPKVSRHLATLRETGLVAIRKEGPKIFYAIAANLPPWVPHVLRTTRLGNPAYIRNAQHRLAAMNRHRP